jgi:transaldolase
MVEQARVVSTLASNAVIKLPTNPEGLAAQAILSEEGIKTNLTLIFSTSQAILASCANATYLSPFIGRLEDRGYDGVRLINDLMEINKKYGFSAEVIAASIRDPHQVIEVAKTGVHIVTMPFAVLEKMLANTMTDMDLNKFLDDWENVPGKDEAFK